jgi:hypothetical protein
MPRHALYSLTLLVGLGLLAWPSRSHAGTVVSDSGATVITVGGKRDRLSGQYRSRVGGMTWEGSFEANARSRGTYLGTFSDRPNTEPINQPQIFCVGDVSLKLSQRGRFDPTGLEVTWQVTGGKGCESVGQRFTTTLREALPKADRQGNYQDGNARTYDSSGPKADLARVGSRGCRWQTELSGHAKRQSHLYVSLWRAAQPHDGISR